MGHASQFIEVITGSKFTPVYFQLLPEGNKQLPPRSLYGTIGEHFKELRRFNVQGYGVFICINELRGKIRKSDEVIAIRALFIEMDAGKLPDDLPLKPTITVQSKRGPHLYYSVDNDKNIKHFTPAQEHLIKYFKSDKSIKDLPRVMRLPGFNHVKDLSDPFPVKIISLNKKKHTIDSVMKAYGGNLSKLEFPTHLNSNTPSTAKRSIQFPEESKTNFISNYDQWIKTVSTKKGNENPLGGRNCALLMIIREGLALNISKQIIEKKAIEYANTSGESIKVVKPMLEKQLLKHNQTPFKSYFVTPSKEYNLTEIVLHFLAFKNFMQNEFCLLQFYRGDFYQYEDGYYSPLDKNEIKSLVVRHLQEFPILGMKSNITNVNNVMLNLEACVRIQGKIEPPTYIGESPCSEEKFIPLKNGLLNRHSLTTKKTVAISSSTFS